ncbi:MAG: DUF4174 domain-containing protein [Paracoccaceae bacterium]|jgi:hypothetical protein|nr:DUF4174 domain-containing protein [Paracoccaceae bacterium]MDP7184634.1 DUF4174 domain-containing protein [Paracoccaceae bacterium]
MRAFTALFLSAALAAPVFAQETTAPETPPKPVFETIDAADVTLDEFLWIERPVVVFADSPFDPRFQEQMELMESDFEELLLRDVVVITDTNPNARTDVRIDLRPRGFALVLIGKDGQVKLRKPAPWDVREISHAIDKWPIRLKEIRDAQGKE